MGTGPLPGRKKCCCGCWACADVSAVTVFNSATGSYCCNTADGTYPKSLGLCTGGQLLPNIYSPQITKITGTGDCLGVDYCTISSTTANGSDEYRELCFYQNIDDSGCPSTLEVLVIKGVQVSFEVGRKQNGAADPLSIRCTISFTLAFWSTV